MSWDDDDVARDKDDPWRGANYFPDKEDEGGDFEAGRRSGDVGHRDDSESAEEKTRPKRKPKDL